MKTGRVLFILIFGVSLLVMGLYLSLTQPIIQKALDAGAKVLEHRFGYELSYTGFEATAFGKIRFKTVSLRSLRTPDLQISAHNLEAELSIVTLLWRFHPLSKINIESLSMKADLSRPPQKPNKAPEKNGNSWEENLRALLSEVGDFPFYTQANIERADFELKISPELSIYIEESKFAVQPSFSKIEFQVSAKGGQLKFSKNRHIPFSVDSRWILEKEKVFRRKSLTIETLGITSPGLSLHLKGPLQFFRKEKGSLLNLELNMKGDFARLPIWLGLKDTIKFGGSLDLKGRLHAKNKLEDIQFDGGLALKRLSFGAHKVEGLDASIKANRTEIVLSPATLFYAGAKSVLKLTAQLEKHLPYELSLDAENLSLYRLLEDIDVKEAWIDIDIDANISGAGTLQPFVFEGKLVGEAKNLIVPKGDAANKENRVILALNNPVKMDSKIWVDKSRFTFIKAQLDDGDSQALVDCDLFFSKEKGLNISVDLGHLNLITIKNNIAGHHYAGVGSARGTLIGPYQDILIDVNMDLSAGAFEDYNLGHVQGKVSFAGETLRFSNIEQNSEGSRALGDLAINFGEANSMDLQVEILESTPESLDALLKDSSEAKSATRVFRQAFKGPLKATVRVSGSLESTKGATALAVSSALEFLPGASFFEAPLKTGKVTFLADANEVKLETLHLGFENGDLHGQFTLDRESEIIVGGFEAKDLSLSLFPLLAEQGLKGVANTSLNVFGTLTSPKSQGQLEIQDLAYRKISLGDWHLGIHHKDHSVGFFGPMLSGKAHLSFAANWGEGSQPFNGKVIFNRNNYVDMLSNFDLGEEVSIFWDGLLNFSGDLVDNSLWEAKLKLNSPQILLAGLSLETENPIEITSRKGLFKIEPINFESLRGDKVSLSARLTPTEISGHILLSHDLSLMSYFFSKIEVADGKIFAQVEIDGDPNNPMLDGQVRLDGARIDFIDNTPSLEEIFADIQLEGHHIYLVGANAKSLGGTLTSKGRVSLQEMEFYDVDMDLKLDSFPLVLGSLGLFSLVNGSLSVKGFQPEFHVIGRLSLDQAVITKNFITNSASSNVAFSIPETTQDHKFDMYLDLELDLANGITIDNELANMNFVGNIALKGNHRNPELLGDLRLRSGRAFFRENIFEIKKAQLVFEGSAYGANPLIDIEAETEVRDIHIDVFLTGKAKSPQVRFVSDPALAQSEVLGLLTLGLLRHESTTLESLQVAGLEVVSAYTGIARRVNRLLPKGVRDKKIMHLQSLRIGSLFLHEEGTNVPALYMDVALLSRFRIRLKSALSASERGNFERHLEFEQGFSRRLRLRFSWDTQGDSNLGDIGSDLLYRWEF